MDLWTWLQGVILAVIIGSSLGGMVVCVLKMRDGRIRKRESDARALAFYHKHYEERVDGDTHLISLDYKADTDKNWLALDSLLRVKGNAADLFSVEELRERVATMACPLRTLAEYHDLFRRECRYDGRVGQEEYKCTSLDGGNSWFYASGDGVYKGTLAELPEFKLKQQCIERMCARAEKREKRKKVNRLRGMLGLRGTGEDEPALCGEDLQALSLLGLEITTKKN